MNHPTRAAAGICALALLTGVALTTVGCARQNGGAPNQQPAAPTAAATQTPQTTAADVSEDEAATPDASAPSEVSSSGTTGTTGNTTDQLDGSLSALDQLINGINASLSGDDNSGGE